MRTYEPVLPPAQHPKALDLVKDELLALDPRSLAPLNLDVVVVAMAILGVVENLPVYRPGLVELFGEERVRKIDRLGLLANAALQAHGRYRGLDSTIQLGPLAKEVMKFREVLLGEVRQLVAREVLDPASLGQMSGTPGYKHLYLDLVQLIAIFRGNAERVEKWCVVRSDYLDAAEDAAGRLAKAVGMKEQAGQPPAADLRNRAFTLLVHTYEECRRQITFLRWFEGDHQRIAPSLYAVRLTGRRKKAGVSVDPEAEPLPPLAASAPASEAPSAAHRSRDGHEALTATLSAIADASPLL